MKSNKNKNNTSKAKTKPAPAPAPKTDPQPARAVAKMSADLQAQAAAIKSAATETSKFGKTTQRCRKLPRITALIATRGEDPENVRRTVEGLQRLGVAVLTEEDTGADGRRGAGRIQHRLALAATTEYLLKTDAHCEFDGAFFDAALAQLDEWNSGIAYGSCEMLKGAFDKPGNIYHGASLDPDFRCHWRKSPPAPAPHSVTETSGIMGANYVFSRDAYFEFGAPLQYLHAWGMEEELLATVFRRHGAKLYLLPIVTKHIHAAPREGRNAVMGEEKRWVDAQHYGAAHWCGADNETVARIAAADGLTIDPAIISEGAALREHLESCPLSFADLFVENSRLAVAPALSDGYKPPKPVRWGFRLNGAPMRIKK